MCVCAERRRPARGKCVQGQHDHDHGRDQRATQLRCDRRTRCPALPTSRAALTCAHDLLEQVCGPDQPVPPVTPCRHAARAAVPPRRCCPRRRPCCRRLFTAASLTLARRRPRLRRTCSRRVAVSAGGSLLRTRFWRALRAACFAGDAHRCSWRVTLLPCACVHVRSAGENRRNRCIIMRPAACGDV